MEDILLAFLLGGFLLVTIIMTWVNRSAIAALEDEQAQLRAQLRQLAARQTSGPAPQAQPSAAPEPPPAAADDDWGDTPLPISPPAPVPPVAASVTAAWPDEAPAAARAPRSPISFEQQFGARLPVWIGGLALILAGFFLVKYSIEVGLLGPGVRVVLGLLFGGGLLAAAQAVRRRGIAGGARITQALSGAGLADLYICIFAACTLYDLIPAWLAFAGMAGVTAGAVFLALEHGVPIALLGLLGGFCTPALISTGHPSALLLFSYLYLLLAGFIFIIRQRHWWLLALPAMLGSFLWVLVWLFGGYYAPADTLWLGLFLLAVSATIGAARHQALAAASASAPEDTLLALGKASLALHYGTLGGAVLLMSLLAGQAGFAGLDWGLFGLLTLGGIALAFFNQRLYGFVPWLTLLANAIMLLVWRYDDPADYGLTLGLFAALFAVSGYVLQARSARPLLWSGLVTASSLAYFLIAYGKLRFTLALQEMPLFWGSLALALAFAAVEMLRRLWRQIPADHPERGKILSLYAATATAFVAVALTIELEREFLSVAFALEMLALCWLYGQFTLPVLRRLAAVLALIFAALLVPQILLLLQLAAYSLVEAQLALQASVPLVQWPLFQLGLPALCFAGGSHLLRRAAPALPEDKIVRAFEVAAVALIGVMGYYLARHAFHPNDNVLFVKAGFGERGAITTILFLYGLGCVRLGRRFGRDTVGASGLVLAGMALFRVLYFDCLRYNPLWTAQDIGSWPIFNLLWLPYGLPVLWLTLLLRNVPRAPKFDRLRPWAGGIMLFLAFVGITMQVRQLYHGAYLNAGVTGNAEIYSYSVAWLLLGIALLGIGTLRRAKLLRVASLLIMIVTVGKVFLYDAAALQGLYRVFSFFGLGLSLMALSWFYARFVFRTAEPRQ